MSRDHLETELKTSGIDKIDLPNNRAAIRKALAGSVARAPERRQVFLRHLFPIGLGAGFVLGIVFMLLLRSSAEVIVADDLGSVWCTYIDTTDEDGVIWPPLSTKVKNNFVKSAPGYGGGGLAVRFKGNVGERNPRGYMGIAAFLGARCVDANCGGVDIQRFRKIRFKMKGRLEGGELILILSNGKPSDQQTGFGAGNETNPAYEAKITDFIADDWRTVTLDLRDDFAPPNKETGNRLPDIEEVLADARQVKWHVRNGKRAVADVWIDELEFY